MDNTYFGEEDFLKNIKDVVQPWLQKNLKEGTIRGKGGIPLHYYMLKNPDEKAAVVAVHGFCEFFAKYHEMSYYFWQRGYSFFFLEQRGHGKSGRETEDPDKVYVSDFMDYVHDQRTFIDTIVLPNSSTKRLFLMAHSMGGLIGTLLMETYPELFEKAVLSSPMLEINYGKLTKAGANLLAVWAKLRHLEKEFVPGGHDFKGQGDYKFATSSARSKARYDYLFQWRIDDKANQINGATYGWTMASMKGIRQARKHVNLIQTPVLLLQAGEDKLVDIRSQDYFLAHTNQTKMVRFPTSRHEIFNSVTEDRKKYYDEIFEFLSDLAKA